ncbi:HAD ATPase, P-type, IC family protein [Clostridium baratii str. Sullivan]|uniref:HAD ATPase, P-type, IC family protein n=1 Tax=Clostridium baratii str. Sullivan TaxID=1415775 RepID=A0A0A7FZN5_9CLOT|nr:cation-translocating P-type ATPase [Clostridium baratii]AIY85057.1 HAD ATPase, P-type, IC family protein [Clostridium baratii str. Sullivan]
MAQEKNYNMKGLTNEEVKLAREKFGKNVLIEEKKENFLMKVVEVIKEPMFLLLMVAAIIYFILGEPKDGSIMLIFVVGVISIEVIQEWKTDKTLKALKNLSAQHIEVIREFKRITINSEELVPGDLMIITEGIKIPADGKVVYSNDLCVNESSLTGEALGVWKCSECTDENKQYFRKDYCYAGTLVIQGSGVILVKKIGANTEYGKIGKNVSENIEEDTLLQKQTGKLVKVCAGIAGILFALVSGITYLNLQDVVFEDRIIQSILSGVTLAMAMIPEEFPVVLTVFLSMGAWRLAKKNSLVRKLPSVETLGAISVLCVDKTGTITMNEMTIDEAWSIDENVKHLLEVMGMACETEAYDPMEKAMIKYCEKNNILKEFLFNGELVTEYSFTHENKMMGHVWKREEGIIVAAKGSPEKILNICDLNNEDHKKIEDKIYNMSSKGLRVIAVGKMDIDDESDIKNTLEECTLKFLGLVGLLDPPREGIKDDIETCNRAGIRVVMITGDNGITASSIARKVGISHSGEIITGDELDKMSDDELREKVKHTNIFSRVIPEHKMRIVKAFKENGEVVGMTGDGVNDAPALKYADIGIAMGKRGSEVSREAADLILLDDNFSTIVDTVKDGRRIYDNIRRAIGYIFTIHIPIAFSAIIAPILGIGSSMLLLLPVHVVLLELIIDPTCSIVLEREPAESDIMRRKPRNPNEGILTKDVLIKSIIQGVVMFLASFGTYYIYYKCNSGDINIARTMGLSIIIISNILLVYVNSSSNELVYKSFNNLIKDKVMWGVNGGTIIGLLVIMYTPISGFLKLAPLGIKDFLIVIAVSIIAVMWYEIVKIFKKKKQR